MKKIFTFLGTGAVVIALCAEFSACNEPKRPEQDEEGTEIQAVPVSDDVADFFDGSIRRIGQSIFNEYNELNMNVNPCIDSCVMINSMDELPEIIDYSGTIIKFPDINFISYTLVIGQCILFDSGVYLKSKSLFLEDNEAIMNLIIGQQGGPQSHAIEWEYFWGIYPKIAAETIKMNVTRNR